MGSWFSSKTTSSTQLDPIARQAIGESLAYSRQAADQPFTQYSQPWTAGWNPALSQAGAQIANSASVGSSALGQAGAIAGQAGQYRAPTIGAQGGQAFMGGYFNPFLQQVAGGMVGDMNRARQQQITADEDKALAAGAYGGSRHGVMDAETTRGFYDRLGTQLGGLYAQGFDSAARFGQMDADRYLRADQSNQSADLGAANVRLGGGQLSANVGDIQHDNYLDSSQALGAYGGVRQAYDQSAIDRSREQFNEWRDYPLRQAQIMQQAAGTAAQSGSTTTQSRQPGLAEIGMTIGSALAFKSDRNAKTDVRSLKSDDDALRGLRKTPVQTWRYKGDSKPHIGPMAQNMKRNLGIGDGRSLPVVDVLGAHHAAIKALDKKVSVKIKRKGK